MVCCYHHAMLSVDHINTSRGRQKQAGKALGGEHLTCFPCLLECCLGHSQCSLHKNPDTSEHACDIS